MQLIIVYYEMVDTGTVKKIQKSALPTAIVHHGGQALEKAISTAHYTVKLPLVKALLSIL